MTKIKQEKLDELAELEVQAYEEGLRDVELKRNPSFLEKVRKFLKDNDLKIAPETPGVQEIKDMSEELPEFPVDEEDALN